MKLIHYLRFKGNCEEALNVYRDCFNGSIEHLDRFSSAPGMSVPEEFRKKVLHAVLKFGDNMIMASDCLPENTVSEGENVSLSVDIPDEVTTRKIFEKLSEKGSITMNLQKTFWGALFGQVTDRFGIAWMLNCELKNQEAPA